MLYVQGELGEIDNEAAISIVGSRRCSDYGRKAAGHLAQQLAQAGAVVVSGFAAGIDAAAHLGALRARGKTVAVLGCGLDVDYPSGREEMRRMIAATGALVTEYPPGTQPLSGNFPCRNRILSGLALGVVVVEGNRRSGSLITAGLAAAPGAGRVRGAGEHLQPRVGRAPLAAEPGGDPGRHRPGYSGRISGAVSG